MPAKCFSLKSSLIALALLVATFAGVAAYLAQRPDFEMRFTREVPVQSSPREIGKYLWTLQRWPEWFFKTAKVERVDISGNPYAWEKQVLEVGALIRFSIDPKKGKHRRFQLVARVTEYEPEKKVSLRIIEDSTGRLTQRFAQIDWTIEIVPGAPLLIRGTETAITQSSRARIFGAIAERTLMNQLFYPDLLKLAEIMQPSDRNQMPSYMR